MYKLLVVGASGMFGSDFCQVAKNESFEVIETNSKTLDITNKIAVDDFFANNNFDYVINAAAYTDVDKAEEEPKVAYLINETGVLNLAVAAKEKNVPIIHISTDYVFKGDATSPYKTTDKTDPQGIYGKSKLAGEIALQKTWDKFYLCRTSWLYGKNGKNFVDTMISLSKKMSELKVVNDQKGCPTWTVDLASAVINLIKNNKPYGIYHTCSSGKATWFEFAKEIFRLSDINICVKPCSTNEFPRPAKRPSFSVMENDGIIRHWQKGLKEYLKRS